MDGGFDGLLRDKTRRSRIAPLGAEVAEGGAVAADDERSHVVLLLVD
jgi:hypothetical protein